MNGQHDFKGVVKVGMGRVINFPLRHLPKNDLRWNSKNASITINDAVWAV